ncbi:MAG: LysM peptidoglycan-binding domain-containing protein [Halanaerobium sp. MSAO_Bac5]|nr:MAG: LysM peptidoglycan-binding domain-containing protein [Halanaerobium sp. MSAO_Bac5]
MKNRDKIMIIFIITLVFLTGFKVSAAPNLTLVYVIQQGDTLSEIASDFGISTNELRNFNEINSNFSIKMGEELLIPLPEAEKKENKNELFSNLQSKKSELSFSINTSYAVRINPSQQRPDISDIPEDKIIDYYVGPGDTLYDLARDFSTTIGTILALNNKEDNSLRSGEKLRLPVHNLTSHQILNQRVSRQELNLLARAVYGEARGEPYLGQVAVAAVIINRVLSNQFPNTFAEVIYQQGQFCVVSDGQINLTPNQQAYNAARDALEGSDPTNGALYFYNPRTATNTSFFRGRRVITQIGEHLFIE